MIISLLFNTKEEIPLQYASSSSGKYSFTVHADAGRTWLLCRSVPYMIWIVSQMQ